MDVGEECSLPSPRSIWTEEMNMVKYNVCVTHNKPPCPAWGVMPAQGRPGYHDTVGPLGPLDKVERPIGRKPGHKNRPDQGVVSNLFSD
jgi:hypothetical protein